MSSLLPWRVQDWHALRRANHDCFRFRRGGRPHEGSGAAALSWWGERSNTLARPQSTTSDSLNGPSRMLAGFKSRWSTPRLCA